MEEILGAITRHGYPILCTLVFFEAVGFPVPAALALLIAGAILPAASLPAAIVAILAGDTLMFFVGRYTGWWLLTLLCRLSLNPESCILGAADSFYKRGRWVLAFAKFVPGINTMAPPLAGSMNMRVPQFLAFDLMGASLYAGVFWGTGFLFADFLETVKGFYRSFGTMMGWAVVTLFIGYLLYHAVLWMKSRNLSPVPRVSVAEVVRRRDSMAIYDVRSHGYYEKGASRIPGSTRIEPGSITQGVIAFPEGKEIIVYCTCVREATSTRVARALAAHGVEAAIIVGGFNAWKKAGLPIEPVPEQEMIALPMFA